MSYADGEYVMEPPINPEEKPQGKNTAANLKTNNRIKRKLQAVIIKPAEGNSYAEVLQNNRSKVNLKAEVKVKGIRKTWAEALLL